MEPLMMTWDSQFQFLDRADFDFDQPSCYRMHRINDRSPGIVAFLPQRAPKTNGKPGHDQPIAGVDIAWQQTDQDQGQHQAGQQLLGSLVHGIYAGLVMVESKCIEVDNTQIPWQALMVLHRTLLHEHHDFFLACQHPTANMGAADTAPSHSAP